MNFFILVVLALPYIEGAQLPNVPVTEITKEKVFLNGPKLSIKTVPFSSRQRSDLHEIYLAPYRYLEKSMRAVVTVQGSNSTISGTIHLSQETPPAGPVTLKGIVTGLKPGKHGIHVNHLGDISANCINSGLHYNPYNFNHGPPGVQQRHAGDLGNIDADHEGIANFAISDKMLSLVGSRSIIGRSIVIDEFEDDFGKQRGSYNASSKNVAAPVACGIIGRID